MKFNTVDEAKEYVVLKTNKIQSLEEIESTINYYQKMANSAFDDKSRDLWILEFEKINAWKQSDDFNRGNYPQGIDELILELVEWRSIIYAFQNVETVRDPFKESGFYAQWYIGAIYGIFSIFGKLLSKHNSDNSLRKLWRDISLSMLNDGSCTKEEVDYIDIALDEKLGRFTNSNSQALLFRNKHISHNEVMPIVEWDEVDKDFAFLIRIWSLLVSWSSFGLHQPFRTNDQAYLGVESMFGPLEIINLKNKRQEYLKMVEDWSRRYVHTGTIDTGRSAFSSLSVNLSIVSNS